MSACATCGESTGLRGGDTCYACSEIARLTRELETERDILNRAPGERCTEDAPKAGAPLGHDVAEGHPCCALCGQDVDALLVQVQRHLAVALERGAMMGEDVASLNASVERLTRERDEARTLAGRIADEWRERYANLEQRFTELAASESNRALRARVAGLTRERDEALASLREGVRLSRVDVQDGMSEDEMRRRSFLWLDGALRILKGDSDV